MKVAELIRLLEKDGLRLARTRGSHRQYKHQNKPRVVTVPGRPSRDLPHGLTRSLLKAAQLLGDD